MAKKTILLDGLLIPASQKFLHGLRPGFLKGKGVFETMRACGAHITALDLHLTRLMHGLAVLGITLPVSRRKLKQLCKKAIDPDASDARLRLTVWREKRKTRVAIVAAPYVPYPSGKYEEGCRAVISDIRRDERSPETRIKSINYILLLRAWRRARQRGNDEALLLNREGYLVEGSRTNVFFVKNKTLVTPALSSGCLDGVTRRIVLRLAHAKGLRCSRRRFRPDELCAADEAFLTNSLIGVMPLTAVQGRVIGSGRPGPVTVRLMRLYRRTARNA